MRTLNNALYALLDDVLINDDWMDKDLVGYDLYLRWKQSNNRCISGKNVHFEFHHKAFSFFTYNMSVYIEGNRTNFNVFKLCKRGRLIKKIKKRKIDTQFEQEIYKHLEEKQSQRVKDLVNKISELEQQGSNIMDEIDELINKGNSK